MTHSPSGREGKPAFRNDINGLRALSVTLVVFFHLRTRGSGGGFIGVDIFLVISGFLMTTIIQGALDAGKFSLWEFLCARAARIWPALGTLVGTLLVLGAVLLPPSDLSHMADQAVWALAFWSNEYFLKAAGYATDSADGNWFLHTWSLSLEWQFYLLYPLALMAAARFRLRKLAAALVAVLMVLSFGRYLHESASHPNDAFFSLAARAWEPLAGGLIAWLARDRVAAWLRALASYSGVALILVDALWLGYRHADPVGLGAASVVPVVGALLIIGSACPNNRILANPFMQTIGRWSYSIYLWHWPLVVICAMDAVLERFALLGSAFVLAGSGLLGWASYRFIETRPSGGSPGQRRLHAAKPLLIMGSAALAVAIVMSTHGLEFRMPPSGSARVKPAAESDYFPAACSNFQKRIEEVRTCKIDKHTARTVLVIGDSLAEQLYPWFKNHSEVSVDFYTEADCPPVPHFDRLQPGFHCMDFTTEAWREALQPRYDTVIISANWNTVGGVGPVYCHSTQGVCTPVKGDARRNLALQEIRSALQALLAAGKTVVMLEGSPSTYLSVPQRIERERYWFGAPRFTIPLASVIAEHAWIDGMFAALKGVPGFHLVSLRPTLCGPQVCQVYDATLQEPVYIDGLHFDPIWVKAHGGIFSPFVQLERTP